MVKDFKVPLTSGKDPKSRIVIGTFKNESTYQKLIEKVTIKYDLVVDEDDFIVEEALKVSAITHSMNANDGHAIYLLFWNTSRPEDETTLIHECVHIVNMIFIDRGIEYTKEDDEIFAYTIEHIYETLRNAIFKGELILKVK